jgi:hypothetical protein
MQALWVLVFVALLWTLLWHVLEVSYSRRCIIDPVQQAYLVQVAGIAVSVHLALEASMATEVLMLYGWRCVACRNSVCWLWGHVLWLSQQLLCTYAAG